MSFGSRRWYPYTDDAGEVWGILGDESNIEMVNDGADALSVPAGTRGLPREIKKRFVRLKSGDLGTKTVPVLTQAAFVAIENGQAFAAPAVGEENAPATSFVVVQRKPETRLREPFALDTGKVDGDVP